MLTAVVVVPPAHTHTLTLTHSRAQTRRGRTTPNCASGTSRSTPSASCTRPLNAFVHRALLFSCDLLCCCCCSLLCCVLCCGRGGGVLSFNTFCILHDASERVRVHSSLLCSLVLFSLVSLFCSCCVRALTCGAFIRVFCPRPCMCTCR